MNIFEKLKDGITTSSAEETRKLGAAMARIIPDNVTLALTGDLGSGKTTLVKGLGQGWGIKQEITSPTYNIFFIYENENRQLIHLDAYRLKGEEHWDGLMIEDLIKEPYCLVVEWPEILDRVLPAPVWKIICSIQPNHEHHYRLIR